MAIVVAAEHAERALKQLTGSGEQAMRIGTIVAQPDGEPATVVA
jgi:phosphoribosylaminoimidazole (AIR) synthetase